jgi:endonuclease YncB( thermonuclease family)
MLRILLGTALWLATAAWAVEYPLPPGALHVEDGDTLLVRIDGQEQRVQLRGIDAPEDRDNPKLQRDLARTGMARERLLALGQMATAHLERLTRIGGPHTLHYDPAQKDRYGRLTGDLLDVRGRSLAESAVSAGYAIAARDGTERFRTLQAQAQRESRGLWGLEAEATERWAGIDQP